MSEKMTREERLDWLCRLRAFLVSAGMPNEWRAKFTQAVSDSIAELLAEPCNDTIKNETVTEFADRCKECGSRYGKLLKTEQFAKWVATEIFDDMWEYNKDAFAEIACRKLEKLGIVRAKGDEWELVEPQESEE